MPRMRSNTVDIVIENILCKIENYELKSGDIVSDSELATEFKVSRTPIREAIMTLIENGVLERSRTKVIVRAITLTDIIEIIDVRDAIEGKSVELIIKNGGFTKEQFKVLTTIQEEMKSNIQTGNVSGNFHADHKFHLFLVECTKNQRLINFYKTITLQSRRLRWLAQLTPGRFNNSLIEHQEIIEAVNRKDIILAKQNTHHHLENTKRNYQSILLSPQWMNLISEIRNMTM